MPEIIEDICQGYEERFGVNIQSEISGALKPCVVKFVCDPGSEERHRLEPSIGYCWCKINNENLINANTCL
jgi:hypothetical protein